MACPKIVQENIGRPTEVRMGLGLFRRFEIFGLRFTPLVPISVDGPQECDAGLEIAAEVPFYDYVKAPVW